MKGAPLDVKPSRSAIRHRILGTHFVDAPVAGIEVLMHRYVELERWSLRMAANAFWRLYWPVSEGGRVEFHGESQTLDPGSLYLISPHTAFHSECDRVFRKWYLHFDVGGMVDACPAGIVRIRPTARILDLLSRVCPDPGRSKKTTPPACHPLESLELALLALQSAIPRFRLSANADDRLPRCVAYLREHLAEKITLAQLARCSGLGIRTLSHLFTSDLGMPPMRYLIELRLNHAMKLLRHTDHTIERISEECGFPNRYYLTRMLSKYRKTTPAAFRSQVRKNVV